MNELERLGHDYWEWVLEEHPTYATYLGDHRYDHLLEDLGDVARKREELAMRAFLDRLLAIDHRSLSAQDRISADVLRITLEQGLESIQHHFEQWGIDQMSGPQVSLFELMNWHPLKTDADLQNLLSRFRQWPRYMLQYMENLREGIPEMRRAPAVAVQRVRGQVAAILQTPIEKSPLLPADVLLGWKVQIITALKEWIYPAFESFAHFLDHYAAREEIGISAMRGGKEAYEFLVRDHTTTNLAPKEIHEIGKQELARIHEEIRAITKTRSVRDTLEKLHEGKSNTYASKDEIMQAYFTMLARCWKALPQWFGTLPKQPCDIKPIEEYRERDAPGAYYYPPPDDRSRPGVFYINTYKPGERPRSDTATLTAHEAVPGHHLQIALAQEQSSLPPYRRHGGFTAFVEGWALYAERLGDRMGLYHDDLERLGMLAGQAFRASRLVVDTGIHAFGWSREKAFKFHQENAGLSDVECSNEIDRYIIIPGQALAYMIGRREIESCRTMAEKALGRTFDIRRFHDTVLLNGAVPLTTLRKLVAEWCAQSRSK